MWSISTQRHSYCLRLHNLPTDVTAEALAEYFWSRVGINLGVECFDIQKLENGATSALCAIPRRSMADFFDRCVSQQLLNGKQIIVRANWVRPNVTPDDGRESESE